MPSETMVTQCPQCGNRFKTPVASAGMQATCGKCGGLFVVVEKAPQPTVYISPKKTTDDDILSPPVRTPSYTETPIKSNIGSLGGNNRQGVPDDDFGRTRIPIGGSAPSYWALRCVAGGHVLLGVLGMIAGFVLIAYALFGTHGGDKSVYTSGGGLFVGWGIVVLISGIVSVAFGQALRALRDMAINSFLALNR